MIKCLVAGKVFSNSYDDYVKLNDLVAEMLKSYLDRGSWVYDSLSEQIEPVNLYDENLIKRFEDPSWIESDFFLRCFYVDPSFEIIESSFDKNDLFEILLEVHSLQHGDVVLGSDIIRIESKIKELLED